MREGGILCGVGSTKGGTVGPEVVDEVRRVRYLALGAGELLFGNLRRSRIDKAGELRFDEFRKGKKIWHNQRQTLQTRKELKTRMEKEKKK